MDKNKKMLDKVKKMVEAAYIDLMRKLDEIESNQKADYEFIYDVMEEITEKEKELIEDISELVFLEQCKKKETE